MVIERIGKNEYLTVHGMFIIRYVVKGRNTYLLRKLNCAPSVNGNMIFDGGQ